MSSVDMPELSQPESNPYKLDLPLWLRITDIEQIALINYQKRHYPKRPLRPPGTEADIMDFDPAKEMGAPKTEEHMRW